MDALKDVGSFEDDLYTDMSENSSEFFTEARNIWYRDKIFWLTSTPVWGFSVGVVSFYSGYLLIQSG